MRLKNIYWTLKEVEPTISSISTEKVNGSTDNTIKNWSSVLSMLGKLKKIEPLSTVENDLFNISPIFGQTTNIITIASSHVNPFNTWLTNIRNKVKAIIELCESLGYANTGGSFEVKLPETDDLEEFANNINDFSKAVKICPFIKDADSSIRLTKTDIGSTWLEFTIISASAISILTALGYFAQSALKIRSMYLTCQQQKEAVRGYQAKNDLAESLTEMYKDVIKATAANEVLSLEENLNITLGPEERNSAERSIDILGKLMSKGLEIYAALDTPPEAKDVFPSIRQQELLAEPVKLISDK